MLFINTPEYIGKLEREVRALLGHRAHVTRSDPEYLEYVSYANQCLSQAPGLWRPCALDEVLKSHRILHPHTNKGEGVARACKALGVPLEEVVAFGDADVCRLVFLIPDLALLSRRLTRPERRGNAGEGRLRNCSGERQR